MEKQVKYKRSHICFYQCSLFWYKYYVKDVCAQNIFLITFYKGRSPFSSCLSYKYSITLWSCKNWQQEYLQELTSKEAKMFTVFQNHQKLLYDFSWSTKTCITWYEDFLERNLKCDKWQNIQPDQYLPRIRSPDWKHYS